MKVNVHRENYNYCRNTAFNNNFKPTTVRNIRGVGQSPTQSSAFTENRLTRQRSNNRLSK